MSVFFIPHVSDRLELHNNNWDSRTLHPDLSKSGVKFRKPIRTICCTRYMFVRLSMRPDTPLHGNNERGAKYAVYYASVVTHTVFRNIKCLHSALCQNKIGPVASLACLFPGSILRTLYFFTPDWTSLTILFTNSEVLYLTILTIGPIIVYLNSVNLYPNRKYIGAKSGEANKKIFW